MRLANHSEPFEGLASNKGFQPTPLAIYDIEDPTVLEIGSGGVVKALQPGTTKVKASYQMLEAELTVTVVPTPSSSSRGSSSSSSPRSSSSDSLGIFVDGKVVKQYGKVVKGTAANGQSTISVTLVGDNLQDDLQEIGQLQEILIAIPEPYGQTVTRMDHALLSLMISRQSTLVIQTPDVRYELPLHEVDWSQLQDKLDSESVFEVKITALTEEEIAQVADYAEQSGSELLQPPYRFTIEIVQGSEREEITHFLGYVTRSFMLSDSLHPNQVTTGVLVRSDGTLHHVPTRITRENGQYIAELSSLTNSTYALIHRKVTFADVAHHWSQSVVSESAARLIVFGKSEQAFDPDSFVTRAEFTTMLNRALGLHQATESLKFHDVSPADWFYDAVQIGAQYGLISGAEDGTFKPNATITREESMVMLSRALILAGENMTHTHEQIEALLGKFSDGASVSDWAKAAVAACIDAEIVRGSGRQLAPQGNLTRAEAATLIVRLLEQRI